MVVDTDVLELNVANGAAALAEVAERLASDGINIEYAYGSADGADGVLFVRVSDIPKAEKILRDVRT